MTVTKLPEPCKMDLEIDGMFQVLPCASREEIANKLSKEMGYKISVPQVDSLIQRLRDNSEHYGWDVPHARKGIRTKQEEGPRYFQVLVAKGKEPYFHKDQIKQLRAGAIAQILTTHTSTAHQAEALKYAAQYLKDTYAGKQMLKMARKLAYISEEAGDIYETIQKNGGA